MFTMMHNDTLKTAVRASKTPDNAMEMGTLDTCTASIRDRFGHAVSVDSADTTGAGAAPWAATTQSETDNKVVEPMPPTVEGFLGGKVVNDTHLDYVKEAEVKSKRLI